MAVPGRDGVVPVDIESDATARLAAIVQSSHDAIIGKDLAGRITSWNPGAERLYGYRPDEVLGRHSSMLANAISRDAEAGLLLRITAGEHIEMIRTRRNHKNGTVLDVLLSLSPIVDATGVIVGMSSASRDISEVVSAQGLYEGLLEAAPDAMVCIDNAGRIMVVNQQLERLFGYTRTELVGQPIGLLVAAWFGSAQPWLEAFVELSQSQVASGGQVLATRKDESNFPADISLSSVDLGGTMVVTAAIRDVTSRIAAELALHESEARFRQVAENVDLAIILRTVDPADYLYVSPGFEKVFGYDPIVRGEGPAELVSRVYADDRAGYLFQFQDLDRHGAHVRCEYRITHPDGDTRWIRSTTTPIVDADGTVRRCATVAEDVTEVKHAEVELRAADAAKKANSAKNEFLSRMSHELRTPLNAVLGFAQLLELDELTGEQHAAVAQILHGGRHLVSLINDVLDIAKIESDRLDLSLEAVRISELLSETVAMMTPMANAARVTLSYRAAREENQYVHGDSLRLRQVLLNLLSNAIKYNRPGGRVSVRSEPTGTTSLNFIVQDTGLGISAGELPRLFTPFDRLGAETSGIEGTGVGLALSHRLMTAMGGSLRATSELGVGSIFTASIPLAAPRSESLEFATQPSAPGHGANAVTAPVWSLLYIEDNSSNIELMERVLSHRPGWQMIAARDGSTGIELSTTRSLDLVLLDLHLPDTNGLDVLRRLAANPSTRSLPVVIVSADASPSQIHRLLAAGAHAYLTKPLDLSRVLELLDSFVPEPVATPV